MYSAVCESVIGSETVHTHRGRKEKASGDIEYVWERVKVRDGYEYVINRDIPQIQVLTDTLDEKQTKMFEMLLSTIEQAFPSSALYLDIAKGNFAHETQETLNEEESRLIKDLEAQFEYIKNNQLDLLRYCQTFMHLEPYCTYPNVIQRIEKEIELHERDSKTV